MHRKGISVALLLVLALALLGAGPASAMTIDPELQQTMVAKGPQGQVDVLMVIDSHLDLAALDSQLAGTTWRVRQLRAMDALKSYARTAQGPAMGILEQARSEGRATRIRSLWFANCIAFQSTPDVVTALGATKVPGTLVLDKAYDMISSVMAKRPTASAAEGAGPSGAPTVRPAVTVTAWSVSWINADQVWPLGYDGTGILVAGFDTGVWLTHPDIAGQLYVNPGEIAGNGIDDDGNGYIDDVNGYDFGDNDSNPNDDIVGAGSNHGTHTAGTVAGDGTNGTITGVAPNCRFLVCKVFQSVGGGAALSAIYEAQQYAIMMGARVFTMSLGIEGIVPASLLRVERANADAIRTAGVTLFNSAGNYASTETPPDELGVTARVPAPWNSNASVPWSSRGGVVSVGGTGYKNNTLYVDSSNGPAAWGTVAPYNDWPYPPGLVKPDVSAPGVQVNSLQKPNGYSGDTWTGTSMSCPHAAGTAALMLQKNPSLSPEDIDRILEQTALDLGTGGKDNQFGAGRIDALAAVNAVPATQLPYVVQTGLTVVDGNADGILDPGENIQITIQLTNNSHTVNATSVTATLASSDGFATITDGSTSYADLSMNGGSSDNAGDPFLLTISAATPQGHVMPIELTVSTAEGYNLTIDSKLNIGLPDFLTHDVGNVFLTVTDSGIIGYTDSDQSQGQGFGPTGGSSGLYVGSFWGGISQTYVCNHDYPGVTGSLEIIEWQTTNSPNGRMVQVASPISDQDFESIFNDSGATSPKNIQVTQDSYAYADEGYNNFVILKYTVRNLAVTSLAGYYGGVFCDFDIADAASNSGALDAGRRMSYMFATGGPYFGIKLLYPTTASNLSTISNPTYVYPNGHLGDDIKARLLRNLLTFGNTTTLDDYSIMASAGPNTIAAGGQVQYAFALVYGNSLAELQTNADRAQWAYDNPQAVDAPPTPLSARTILQQNAPNPFNPNTVIRFEVAKEGPVRLSVFDLAGRHVRTLVNRSFGVGQWSVTWDGKDDRGATMPSGMYLYRMENDGQTMTRKMMLVK